MNNLFVDPKIVWEQIEDQPEIEPIMPIVDLGKITMETIDKMIKDAEKRAVNRAKKQDIFANVVSVIALIVAVVGVMQAYL